MKSKKDLEKEHKQHGKHQAPGDDSHHSGKLVPNEHKPHYVTEPTPEPVVVEPVIEPVVVIEPVIEPVVIIEPVVVVEPVIEPVVIVEPIIEPAVIVEPTPEPVIEPVVVVEPVIEPVVVVEPVVVIEPVVVVEPIIEPVVVEPVIEPIIEPVVVVEPIIEPIIEPVVVVEPIIEPVVVIEPVVIVEPVVEPVIEPVVVEPTPEPVIEPVVEPVVEPTPEPVIEPVVEPVVVEPTPDPVVVIEPELEALSDHVIKGVLSKISGLIPTLAIKIFDTQDHTAGYYVRNKGCWCAGIMQQLTCLSPWNSTGANTRAGTAISPKHIIFANHYQIGIGADIRFVTVDDIVVTRKLVGKTVAAADLCIGILDADLPSTISFTKVAPSNLSKYLPPIGYLGGSQIPSIGLDQEEKALISCMSTDSSFFRPANPEFLAYYEDKIVGDSGNPAFLIINEELMLLTTWWYGGGGSGPSVSLYNNEINAAMSSLGGGYQLTTMDLSQFKIYN